MDILDFIRQQFTTLHQRIDLVMQNTSEDQFNWVPSGISNSIAATFLHIQSAEDFHIQTVLQGKPRLWETGGWGQRIDLAFPPGAGRNWEATRGKRFRIAELDEYQNAVRTASTIYLANLTLPRLSDQVNYFGEETTTAQVLDALVIHLAGHAGEIAALKGIQGVKGFPF